MYPEFRPLLPNAHLATIAANFWPRSLSANLVTTRVPYRIDCETTVVALENQPDSASRAQLVCVHGLEGSASAGYLISMAEACISGGVGIHRLNLRACGGTENLCTTMYHSGLTSDTWEVVRRIHSRFNQPVFLAGFSLGGNMVLKLAGEYDCADVLAGVCSISAPIDLAQCVLAIDQPSNFLYARRFLTRLKDRIRRKSTSQSGIYSAEGLDSIRSIWEFDDRFTAPLFGFGSAANYYATQSANRFLKRIRIPALLVAAQDDPLVPIRIYHRSGIAENDNLELVTPEHGGHLGFLARRRPRFWLDTVVMQWMQARLNTEVNRGTARECIPSL